MPRETKKIPPKKRSFLWLIFAIVIPIIVAIILAITIMNMAGVNVRGWAKDVTQKVPIVSSIIDTEEEKDYKEKIERSASTITKQKEEIDMLLKDIDGLKNTVEQLELEIVKAEREAGEKDDLSSVEEVLENESQDEVKQLSASFRKMNKKQAALIFKDLNNEIAILVLQQLSNDVRGNILGEMEPKRAAELMELFLK